MPQKYTKEELKEISQIIVKDKRNININIILGKYKATPAYEIPKNINQWLNCRNCKLKPLTWCYDNGSSTACGCGENEYNKFSIYTESIMSYLVRNNLSAINYNYDKLRINWNYWVINNNLLETKEHMASLGRW